MLQSMIIFTCLSAARGRSMSTDDITEQRFIIIYNYTHISY